jgi:UDP-GlcNAc:undecaprenyl-phosphate GlcNAc-1-phosphate transferase
MLNFTAFLLSLFISIALIPILPRLAARFHMVDLHNQRKVHAGPIPRIGGAAIGIAAFIPIIFGTTADNFIIAYLLGAGILVIFGIVDDMRGLGYKAKFLGQFLAALVIVFYGGVRIVYLGGLLPEDAILTDWFATALTLVLLVGVINAINLADGLDGLAGGITLLSFCCIGYLAYLLGDKVILLISLAMGGAIFGFLRFNTYPATLFMGDTGSQLLGFSAGVLAIKITQSGNPLSPVLPLIILGFPILDTLTVMAERIRDGRSPFSADKNHFHHRLMRFGLFHTEAVLVIYIIQALLIASAILFKYHSDWTLLIGYIVFAALIVAAFAIGDKTSFQLKRAHVIDHLIKKKLRFIKDERWIIKLSFAITRFLIPQLFVFAAFLPAGIPRYFSPIVLGLILLIALVWIFRREYMNWLLRGSIYFIIPVILYLAEQKTAVWINKNMEFLFIGLLIIGVFFVILTVKYSQRKKGFQATPMDFLILFIAVALPNLPDQLIRSHDMGRLAVGIIVFFFSYEVLITELRGKFNAALTVFTLEALILIGARGIIGL